MAMPRMGKTYYKDNEPDYNPYGSVFTERQLGIIYGCPASNVRKDEIIKVIRKAEKMGEYDIAMDVYENYEEQLVGKRLECKYTIQEAKAILQSLTQYKIDWD